MEKQTKKASFRGAKSNKKYSSRRKSFGNKFNSGRKRYSSSRKRNFSKKTKSLDTKLFIQEAKDIKKTAYNPARTYSEMALHPLLHKSLALKQFEHPTEIQDKTIDHSILGKDILGIANTGTGKTGAFLIPIINKLLNENKNFQTLIVLPTRELAIQVQRDFQSLTRGFGLFSVSLVGGTPAYRDIKRLKMKNHLIIGTPGRLIDMVKRNALKLNKTEILVLDEFDRMLDMGFVDDVKFLISEMDNIKQTMLFSATLDKKLQPIIESIVPDPHKVMVSSGLKSSENVEQDIVRVRDGETKFDRLLEMLGGGEFEKTIVFTETKRAVDLLYRNLKDAGLKAEYIHGDKPQRAREFSLKNFKNGRVDILIATDVAARGLDIKGVTHVINYEPPKDYDSYIHRIGRTGRAGKKGHAFTFIK